MTLTLKEKNSQVKPKQINVTQNKNGYNLGLSWLCCSVYFGWNLGHLDPGDDGSGFRAGAGSHGCSCPVSCDCDVAYMHPDRGPGSPGRGPAAHGYAASRTTCGCVPCAPAHCGNFHLMSSGCVAHSG